MAQMEVTASAVCDTLGLFDSYDATCASLSFGTATGRFSSCGRGVTAAQQLYMLQAVTDNTGRFTQLLQEMDRITDEQQRAYKELQQLHSKRVSNTAAATLSYLSDLSQLKGAQQNFEVARRNVQELEAKVQLAMTQKRCETSPVSLQTVAAGSFSPEELRMADLIQNRDRLATLQQQEQQPQEQQQEQQHEPQQHEQRATLNYDAQHKRYYSVNPATGVPTWEDPWAQYCRDGTLPPGPVEPDENGYETVTTIVPDDAAPGTSLIVEVPDDHLLTGEQRFLKIPAIVPQGAQPGTIMKLMFGRPFMRKQTAVQEWLQSRLSTLPTDSSKKIPAEELAPELVDAFWTRLGQTKKRFESFAKSFIKKLQDSFIKTLET